MLLLLITLGFLFFASVAMTINEGLWSNTILLLCILISGLVGIVAGVPLGVMILEKLGKEDSFAWYCVFAGVWGVFVLTMVILRILTDKASRTRVRFLPVVDKIGGILMALAVAVMLTSFSAFTLVTVPINAGEWKKSDASDSVKSGFAYARNPFRVVLKNFVKSEEIDATFYGK